MSASGQIQLASEMQVGVIGRGVVGRPYPGPRPFAEEDRDRFFGRAEEAITLAELWQSSRLTLVVGQAGCGKTSLLRAGVLPSLAQENLAVLPVGRLSYGATFPFAALPAHNPYTLALLRSWSPSETITRLAGLTIKEFIQRQAGKGAVLAAIDPADELLSAAGPRMTYRRRFLGELADALRALPRLHLLVVARDEATSLLAEALGSGARYEVGKLTWRSALDAVSLPIVGTGRSFRDGAAEKLLVDLQASPITADERTECYVADDHVEPALLQVVCAHLWASLPSDVDVITARDIRRYGDVDMALATYWGSVIAEVADEHDVTAQRLTSWLRSTFVTDLGTRNKAHEGTTATAGMPNAMARALEDYYLLTSQPQAGSRWYELLCDRLIEPLRKTADARPPTIEPTGYLRAAERALALGHLDLAERHAKEVLRIPLRVGPRIHAEARTLLGNIAFEREKPGEAEVHYREAAGLYGAVSDIQAVALQLAAIGQTLAAQGRYSEAIDELHAAAGRIPNDLVIQVALALALWQFGAGQAAVAILTATLSKDGSNIAALQARGEILADLGEARDAMLDLNRVNLDGRPSARAARGLALAELGDQPAARREIEDAVAEARRNGSVLLYAARAFRESGEDGSARDLARQAANAIDPPLSPPHRDMARKLAGQLSRRVGNMATSR